MTRMAELPKLPHQHNQHPEKATRRAHIYCSDVKPFLIPIYRRIYLLKVHTKHKKNSGISYDLQKSNFDFES